MKYVVWLLFSLLYGASAHSATPLQRMQQLVDYVGVDYPGAVLNGTVINTVEYAEMRDFADTIQTLAKKLPPADARNTIFQQTQRLSSEIERKQSAAQITATTALIRRLLIDNYALSVVPVRVPDLEKGKALYAEQCVACHGEKGAGNGVLATGMTPSPTDFTDMSRYKQRTLYGLYSTITHGVDGTAMQRFDNLTDDERWSLAFFVGHLAPAAIKGTENQNQNSAFASFSVPTHFDRNALTTLTPQEAEQQFGQEGGTLMGLLRAHPRLLFSSDNSSTLPLAKLKLAESYAAYAAGQLRVAQDLAVTAYLDGFELVEGGLDVVDQHLRLQIEDSMTAYRELLKKMVPAPQVEAKLQQLTRLLDQAEQKLATTELSGSAAFASALMILLREGLEAILVIAALAAFLLKTGRKEGLRYLYLGTGLAFLLGVATWYISAHVVKIGGAGRELTEGFAALFAAAMLFYVGFWLHSKTGAAQWKAFIHGSIKKALSKGSLWGLSGLAFIAVYREIFETVLFYQALWLQTSEEGQRMILSGFLVASVVLILLAWLILRYSTRLPLRQFFSVTSVFMFVLAIVFAGKGIAALQEAGKLPMSLVNFPRIDLLGIYPNLEGLGTQLLMLLIAAALLWHGKNSTPSVTAR